MATTATAKPARQANAEQGDSTAHQRHPKASDRRRDPRFPYQTVVTLVRVQKEASFELRKCWTRDLSPGGARIMSLEPIEGRKVLLKFLLPKLGSKFIEAEICSHSVEQQTDIRNRQTSMYLYGVRFTSILDDPETCDRLL
ncbi:MAG: PilZ domain-containing protein [Gemmataceae bacterium]|nr:PilZ domain-containing protein [Gemmataceae bacterium]